MQPWSQLIVQTMYNARTPTGLIFIQWIVLSAFGTKKMPDPRDGAGISLLEIKRLQVVNPASECI